MFVRQPCRASYIQSNKPSTIMGDKSPKANQKKSSQKQAKASSSSQPKKQPPSSPPPAGTGKK